MERPVEISSGDKWGVAPLLVKNLPMSTAPDSTGDGLVFILLKNKGIFLDTLPESR
jgi:hypothetical protein